MLLYSNNRRIPENTWLSVQDYLYNLRVEWKPSKQYVTLIIYDVDAPTSHKPDMSPFLHQLVINISGHDIRSGNVAMLYTPPAPPPRSGDHHYILALYEQEGRISEQVNRRERFDVDSFVQRNKLVLKDYDIIVVDSETVQFYVEPKQITVNPAHPLILGTSTLSEDKMKFCSCLIEESTKMPIECVKKRESYTYEHGKTCYNPFAVCAKSVGTTSRECPQNYNFNAMDDEQIEAFAALHNISLSYPVNREALFEMFASQN